MKYASFEINIIDSVVLVEAELFMCDIYIVKSVYDNHGLISSRFNLIGLPIRLARKIICSYVSHIDDVSHFFKSDISYIDMCHIRAIRADRKLYRDFLANIDVWQEGYSVKRTRARVNQRTYQTINSIISRHERVLINIEASLAKCQRLRANRPNLP